MRVGNEGSAFRIHCPLHQEGGGRFISAVTIFPSPPLNECMGPWTSPEDEDEGDGDGDCDRYCHRFACILACKGANNELFTPASK